MSTALALPEGYAPSNLHLAPSVQTRFVDSDMFDICKRLAHLDRRLFIVQLEETDPKLLREARKTGKLPVTYVIMERGLDGGAYMVLKTKELDARVLERIQYLMRVPLDKRFEEAERLEAKAKADMERDGIEAAYERMGQDFRHQLKKDGFIVGGPSYPTKGVAQPRKHR